MKPHQPELKMRAFKVTEAPKLRLDEVFSPTMTMNQFFSEPASPEPHDGSHKLPLINGSIRSPSAEPIPPHRDHHVSAKRRPRSDSRLPTPPPQESDIQLNSPQMLSEAGTPTSELSSLPWSSAIGRATTGKSGRVIEKLMGDNDRLQREKTLATVRLEEEMKRGESARSALESLQISNANLLSIHDSDKTFLTKKDRRIEDLRADLEVERSRREKAERDTRDTRQERDEMVEQLRKDSAEDKLQAQRSNTQYELLSRSWRTLEEKYEKQASRLKNDFVYLQKEVEKDKSKLAKVDVILEQLTQEGDKSRKAKDKLLAEFQMYKVEQETGLQNIRQRAVINDTAHDRTLKQMENMIREMRYVVNLKRNLPSAGED